VTGTAALRRELAAIGRHLGRDELQALVTIAARAWAGQARYGCLDLHRDRRDFGREASEELADATFYLTTDLLHRRRGRR
jgi:tRNA 2-selenouridine synthase SelU